MILFYGAEPKSPALTPSRSWQRMNGEYSDEPEKDNATAPYLSVILDSSEGVV
jgi:hypothetical protein